MSPRARKLLIQAAGFVLAVVLLLLALRGTDLTEIWRSLVTADYRWLAPVVAVLLFSHVLRAWRWQLLLRALPADELGGRTPRLQPAFFSIMIGYMVNYAAPRLGEVARTANMSSRERLPFSSVLGTVVAERVLDVLMLILGLLTVILLLADRMHVIERMLIEPLRSQNLPLLLGIAVVLVVLTVSLLIAFRHILRSSQDIPYFGWMQRLKPLFVSFRDGFATVARAPQRLLITGITITIWLLYAVAAHLPFMMLQMAATYDITFVDSWSVMILGALGVVVPSPGGTGSYHYITVETLVNLFGVDRSPAASYAFLTHAAQFVLYVVTGLVCMLLQATFVREKSPAAPAETIDGDDRAI